MQQAHNYLQSVRDQYEDYPYPKRNPQDEKKRLLDPFYDALDLVNYYCFEGKQTYQDNFRVLIAGGGTGDAAVFLAEQLRDTNAEIIYVDISQASMAIAKARAEIRGLTNITWIHNSLLEVPRLGIGQFDYINSSGVLHHLANPSDGLSALKSVLKEEGAMGLLIYGQHGRTGIYHIQELMRLLGKNVANAQEKVELCKELLAILPPTNWFNLGREEYSYDIQNFGDIGIYDLLLHSQDRAYTVPQLYEWVEGNGLHLQALISPKGVGKTVYNPLAYTHDAVLGEKMKRLPTAKQQAAAELLCGNMMLHNFYVTKKPKPLPRADMLENIPFLRSAYTVPGIYNAFYKGMKEQALYEKDKIQMRHSGGDTLLITNNKHTLDIMRFIDGNRTIGDIFNCIFAEGLLKDTPYSRKVLTKQFGQLFNELNTHDWLLLRHKSVPQFKINAEMQFPVTARHVELERQQRG